MYTEILNLVECINALVAEIASLSCWFAPSVYNSPDNLYLTVANREHTAQVEKLLTISRWRLSITDAFKNISTFYK